jgi:autotransporter strand-loop-strand O-heptosyltransferase
MSNASPAPETAQASAPSAAPAPAAPESAAPASASAPAAPVKGAYPPPPNPMTQQGPRGIRYDFNMGARIALPEGNWEVIIRDTGTGNIVFATKCGATMVSTRKRHYVESQFQVLENGVEIFNHTLNCRGREVLIQFPIGTLGDLMGWFPYAVRFQEVHQCKLTVTMSGLLIPLFKDAYPHITFTTHEDLESEESRSKFYATYCIGLFFDDEDNTWQPADFRLVGLHRTAGWILGVDPTEFAPKLVIPDGDTRPIAERYVVIAAQSSTQCKYWNNPHGWRAVIDYVKSLGYRVICIDQKSVHGTGLVWNHIPYGAEDQTGDRPITERARWLKHAEFFIGLSSGLSWLAWATGVPVVMISGFTHPTNEFYTPYRIFNTHACNSCWNDVRHRFDHKDFFYCPRHKDTPRQFECTRLITPDAVIRSIKTIPCVTRQLEERERKAETKLVSAA